MTNLFARILIVVKAKMNHELKSFKMILLKCRLEMTDEVVKLFVYLKLIKNEYNMIVILVLKELVYGSYLFSCCIITKLKVS